MDPLGIGMLDAGAGVECLRSMVLRVDREANIAAAALSCHRRQPLQQSLADAPSAEFIGNVKILHIDSRPADPGRETGKVEAASGEAPVDFGDQGLEGGSFAETEAADVVRRTLQLVQLHDSLRDADQRRVDVSTSSPVAKRIVRLDGASLKTPPGRRP